MAGAGLRQEMEGSVPAHLEEWWSDERPYCLHSAAWWQRHWARTGILEVAVADSLPDGWRFWLDWLRLIAPGNTTEIRALESDAGRHLGYVRAVGRLRPDARLVDPALSIPAQYVKHPLLRNRER